MHSLALVADSFHMVRKLLVFKVGKLLTQIILAQRCALALRRTMGCQSCQSEGKSEYVYIWSQNTHGYKLNEGKI